MRSAVLVGVGLLTLFLAVPVMTRLSDVVGPEAVGVLALVCLALACALTVDFKAAMKSAGISQKEAAIAMRISEPTLANQLNEKEPPTRLWSGLAVLGPKFRVEFYKLAAARDECVLLERGEMCDLVNAVQALTADRRRPQLVRQEVAECA